MSKELLNYFNGDNLAANVWQGKYQKEGEKTPDDMHHRMAKEFAKIEYDYILEEREKFSILDNEEFQKEVDKLSSYGEDNLLLNDEELPNDKLLAFLENKIYKLFKDFKYIVPQGSIMSQLGSESIGSLSNCVVIGQPKDSYGGIYQKDEEMAQLFKRRCGVGVDLSTLRPSGVATSNASKSSTGAVSFMHRFSNTTREVAQNGRRGALMISMDINHPDIMEFIKIKRDLTQITGANISVKLNDEFMKAVENNEDYILRFPCDVNIDNTYWAVSSEEPKYNNRFEGFKYNKSYSVYDGDTNGNVHIKRIKAKEYWDEIIKSAHSVAEPGLMYWDSMIENSPDGVYPQYKAITTNPCSEIGMQAYDACRLIAVNLFSFVKHPFTDKAIFDSEKFYQKNYQAMRLSDNLIDLEIQHIDRIIEKIKNDPEDNEVKARELVLWLKIRHTAISSRRTGLGFTALGDTLAALNLKYDSKEALDIIDHIMRIKMASELDCTIDLAVLRGTFEEWDKTKEFRVFEYIEELSASSTWGEGRNNFYQFILDTFPKQAERMFTFGRRNVSWSTVAPTGTVSLLTQTTSGIEPLFQPFYTRRKKINPSEVVKVDFVDENGDSWQEFSVLHPKFRDWISNTTDYNSSELDKTELQELFTLSPWYGSTANDISWDKRVQVQSLIQKYISHSISSTINLPSTVTEKEVSDIYMNAWKQDIKGITVYRDGSRSGVLISNEDSSKKEQQFEYKDASKRPKCLPVDIFTITNQGSKWNVIVGLVDKKPYEVFATPYFTNKTSMELCKQGKGKYDLINLGEVYSEDITSGMNDEQEVVTRLISTSLRHGTDIKFIVEQLSKTNGDMFTFAKVITRVLKKYIKEGAKSTITCKNCGSSNVIFEEGCSKCLDCGDSKCG